MKTSKWTELAEDHFERMLPHPALREFARAQVERRADSVGALRVDSSHVRWVMMQPERMGGICPNPLGFNGAGRLEASRA